MTTRRLAVTTLLLLVAVLLQLTAIAPLPFPWGRPDLPVLAVVALSLAWGPIWGSATGFATGLMLDIAPPADHPVGQLALCYAVVGYAVGCFADPDEHAVTTTMLAVVAATFGLVALDLALGVALGSPTVTGGFAGQLLLSTAGYDVVLAPFVVPLISRLVRRVEAAAPR